MQRQTMLARTLALAVTLGLAMTAPVKSSDGPVTRLSSPVLGYVFDEDSQTIRVVSGVPGSASLGAAVKTAETLHDVTVSSAGRVAIGRLKDDSLALIAWTADLSVPAVTASLATALNGDVQVAFSSNGRKAAISDGATVEVWNTGTDPSKVRTFPASGVVAVNGDGVVAVAAPGLGLSLYSGGDPQLVAPGDWSAVAFASNGTDLLAADAGRLDVVRISGGALTTIAALPEKATSILSSLDGGRIAVLAGEHVVTIPATGDAVALECGCSATALDALTGGLVAALRGTSIVLDADGAAPRLTTLFHLLNAGGSAQ